MYKETDPYVTTNSEYLKYDIPGEALTDERFANMIREAEKYLGYPYVRGGSSPSTSFDCSGFTSYVYRQFGYSINRTASGQLDNGTSVSMSELQPGDLVMFRKSGSSSRASHVGIYIGGDQFIHASSSSGNSRCVTVSSLAESYYANHYYTARRH